MSSAKEAAAPSSAGAPCDDLLPRCADCVVRITRLPGDRQQISGVTVFANIPCKPHGLSLSAENTVSSSGRAWCRACRQSPIRSKPTLAHRPWPSTP